ncbi:hypothetical protein BHE74_00038773 [Ensete ventricosum]|nr:hypothetical protein GW17_00012226 [Ensete ventricosum]RWW54646.1 hypothetical protein BHE74_00038773 [Ensete ventricosum]
MDVVRVSRFHLLNLPGGVAVITLLLPSRLLQLRQQRRLLQLVVVVLAAAEYSVQGSATRAALHLLFLAPAPRHQQHPFLLLTPPQTNLSDNVLRTKVRERKEGGGVGKCDFNCGEQKPIPRQGICPAWRNGHVSLVASGAAFSPVYPPKSTHPPATSFMWDPLRVSGPLNRAGTPGLEECCLEIGEPQRQLRSQGR